MNWLLRALRPRYVVMGWVTGIGMVLPDLSYPCWTWWGAERLSDRLNSEAWLRGDAVIYKPLVA